MPPERARPGAPPPVESFQFLREAIDILEGTEPTKDQRGEIHRAIELLNRLIKLMRNRDTNSYPTGSRRRIAEARHALNIISRDHSEFTGARKALKVVLRDWDNFWQAEELEE